MEQMKPQQAMNTSHTCESGHCCVCGGCGPMCAGNGMSRGMKKYWVRHFIVLILGVIAAFCAGLKLGEMKGYIMASYSGVPMQYGWMMDRDRTSYGTYQGPTTAPQSVLPVKAQ